MVLAGRCPAVGCRVGVMALHDRIFDRCSGVKRPPVEGWRPGKKVAFDMRINTRGEWIYQNSIVRRPELVKLFASVLRLDRGAFFLVTPQEKFTVSVEDAPFIAVEMEIRRQRGVEHIYLRTNVDDVVKVDARHRLMMRVSADTHRRLPYVHVRAGLLAKVARPVFYQLAERALEHAGESTVVSDRQMGVYSGGAFFPLQ